MSVPVTGSGNGSTTTLLRGGSVLSPERPGATALVVEGERVAWVGTEDEADRHAAGVDEVVDLAGGLVTPAFVDAHTHLSQSGLALDSLDLSLAPDLTTALDWLAVHARKRDDVVLLGFGWDETAWPDARPPTADEVAAAAGADRLVYLSRVDGHSAIVSAALTALAPEVRSTDGWDPIGRVERTAHHTMRDTVAKLIPPGQRKEALRRALRHAASLGLGCVHEISAPHINPPDDLAQIRVIAAEEPVPDVVPYWGELHAIGRALDLGCVGNAGDLCADGSLGSRTARLHHPYADADTAGHGYLTAEEVTEHVLSCTRAGLQAGFHAIGDGGVTAVVDGMAEAARVIGLPAFVGARHRVEHLEMITPEQAAVLARLGVVGSVQPAFDASWGGPDGMYAARLGAERVATMNPFAPMVEAGMRLAFGSDSPVTPLDPWGGVRAAVHHLTPAHRLPVEVAVSAHTRGGWFAARRDELGTLVTGGDASYAVWSTDGLELVDGLPTLEPGTPAPTCLRTVVHGRRLFELPGALA